MHNALVMDGKRSPVSDIRGYFPGTVVDRVMRRWLDQEAPELGQMAGWVEEIIETEEKEARDKKDGIVRWKDTKDKKETIERCQAGVKRLEVVLMSLVIPHGYQCPVSFSVPLTVPGLDGTPTKVALVGEMDLMLTKANKERCYGVWDLKFTKDTQYWRKVTGQLLFYDVAVRLGWGAYPVESGLIVPEQDPPYLPFAFTDEDRRQVLLKIATYAEDVWRGDVSLAPKASTCRFCDTKHACPRFAVDRGSRARAGGG